MKTIYINKSILITILLLSLSTAQDVSLKATVSANVMTVDDRFEYSVEVAGKSTSLPDVEFPDFKDFYILSGPNSSTSIQFINGSMTSSKTLSFIMQPKAEGKFTIGKAAIEVNGETYTSNAINITVQKGSAKPQQPQQQAPKNREDPEVSGQDLFLKTEVSRTNAYIGQQITVEYKLYFRVNIRNYERPKPPKNAGFWTEDLEVPKRPRQETEVVNGIAYNIATIHKIALFPTQVGELTVDPMQIKLEVLVKNQRRRSFFDSFFDDPFGRTVQKTVVGKPVKINVKALPVSGKPADFNGAVGDFRFDVSVDKTETATNEAIALKLKLRGQGNIKLVELPKPDIASSIEQYDPKLSTNIENANTISGSKTAEYILIPRVEGEYEIRPIEFSYFNPNTKKYNTITSKPIRLKINKGSGPSLAVGAQGGQFTRQEVALLGKDIRFIKEFTEFHRINKKPYLSFQFIGTLLMGVILFTGFIFYNNYQVKLTGNEYLARSRRAGKYASKQLAEAKKKILSPDDGEFYKAVSLALQGFVRDKLNIELTDFSVVNVRAALEKRKINPQEINEYIAILEESDLRQYANISASSDDKVTLYNKAKDILTKFEKWM
ncbi:MAG: protein BatD [Calditrichaceae bacterium]|nr:protein BatD [Calditrichaceae bacterium]